MKLVYGRYFLLNLILDLRNLLYNCSEFVWSVCLVVERWVLQKKSPCSVFFEDSRVVNQSCSPNLKRVQSTTAKDYKWKDIAEDFAIS